MCQELVWIQKPLLVYHLRHSWDASQSPWAQTLRPEVELLLWRTCLKPPRCKFPLLESQTPACMSDMDHQGQRHLQDAIIMAYLYNPQEYYSLQTSQKSCHWMPEAFSLHLGSAYPHQIIVEPMCAICAPRSPSGCNITLIGLQCGILLATNLI